MTSVFRHRYGRTLGAGVVTVALLSGGTAGAFAASSTPSPTTKSSSSPTTGMASITLTAAKTSLKAGDMVKLAGRTKGLKFNTPLLLQHEKDGKWTALKASTKVKKNNSYAILAKLNTKGTEKLRVVSANKNGKVVSPTVTVKVS
ncbi:hypothetical protein AQI95_17160 [Streptomyces yokosukanensis]|uniref:Bacterial Ig domain-containing protein n=1 Tax=Streptomyces yokosukanensis TaxID=67386 RepID=A0A101P5B7_9ACTN|nr:hypothetical protein [Streptomyces yokosukanensis]KUN05206.1 hypothetical protein AQI95_17160 [Streptomyces yokosukanensis]